MNFLINYKKKKIKIKNKLFFFILAKGYNYLLFYKNCIIENKFY